MKTLTLTEDEIEDIEYALNQLAVQEDAKANDAAPTSITQSVYQEQARLYRALARKVTE